MFLFVALVQEDKKNLLLLCMKTNADYIDKNSILEQMKLAVHHMHLVT